MFDTFVLVSLLQSVEGTHRLLMLCFFRCERPWAEGVS